MRSGFVCAAAEARFARGAGTWPASDALGHSRLAERMKTLAADVDVVANAREAKTTNPERDTFLARAPSSG